MIIPAKPDNEEQRLASLNQLNLLNGESEHRFDHITRVLAALFDVPIAMVNLITGDTQISKSCFGIPSGTEMDRNISFCGHTILSDQPLIIENALEDERFKDNPVVVGGLKVRAYAGIPLRAVDGTHPGALCLVDIKPRKFTDKEISLLVDLSAWAEIELNSSQLRDALEMSKQTKAELEGQLEETKRLNELMIGRELKMVEMKKQLDQMESSNLSQQ